MTVLFFGTYDPTYSRNRVLMRGLRENGVTVVECHADPREHPGIAKYRALYREWKKIDRSQIVYVWVGFPGHTIVWLARLLFRQPIIFDAFLSLYDSNAFDRKVYAPGSVRARIDWFLDWLGCRLAYRVLLDTDAHIGYFVHTFGIPREKFIRVWIGADPEIFHPREAPLPETFTVHFHGTFIPLQGIQYLLDAAKLLEHEDIRFRIVGDGQESARVREKAVSLGLANVEFVGKMPLARVPEYIAASHVCLGIFGDTQKTARVIPNKVYECIAMGKPVITADTSAIREIFEPETDMLLCTAADGESLAAAIRELYRDAPLRERIAIAGRKRFESSFAPRVLAAGLLKHLYGN